MAYFTLSFVFAFIFAIYLRAAADVCEVGYDGCPDPAAIAPCVCSLLPTFHYESCPYIYCNSTTEEELYNAAVGMTKRIYFMELREYLGTTLPAFWLNGVDVMHIRIWDSRELKAITAETFEGCHGLTRLEIYYNQALSTLAERAFYDLGDLEELHLEHNALSDIAVHAFDGLSKLLLLRLRNNKLESIKTGVFFGMPRLEYIELNGNDVQSIEAPFFASGESSYLRLFYMSANKLKRIEPWTFPHLPSLETLDFGFNNISYLDEDMFDVAQNTAKVLFRIGGNPLDCTCDVVWIWEKYWKTSSNLGTCATPSHLENRSLESLSPGDFPYSCRPEDKATTTTTTLMTTTTSDWSWWWTSTTPWPDDNEFNLAHLGWLFPVILLFGLGLVLTLMYFRKITLRRKPHDSTSPDPSVLPTYDECMRLPAPPPVYFATPPKNAPVYMIGQPPTYADVIQLGQYVVQAPAELADSDGFTNIGFFGENPYWEVNLHQPSTSEDTDNTTRGIGGETTLPEAGASPVVESATDEENGASSVDENPTTSRHKLATSRVIPSCSKGGLRTSSFDQESLLSEAATVDSYVRSMDHSVMDELCSDVEVFNGTLRFSEETEENPRYVTLESSRSTEV